VVCTVAPGSSVEYCLQEQEQYYLGGREPSGQWYCPAGQFGLVDGQAVDNGVFRNLHEGLSADGAAPIGKANANGERVGGYDCQFAAPKSVSILWALADDDTRAKIEAAQERAVRAALDLAQQTGQIRTGHNGVTLEKTPIFGATFQHGESRPTEREPGTFRSDPQLHTHTIIFNLGQGADGDWRALDGRVLMALQKAMGAQYHAELSRILETELGARIERRDIAESRHNGEFEVAGVSATLIEQFSTRRNHITDELDKKGLKTAEALALADEVTLATRQGKSEERRSDQQARWAQETVEAGYTWKQIAAQALGQQLDQAAVAERAATYEDSLLAVAERLTETESVFSQPDLYAAIAAAGAGRGHGAVDVRAIEAELIKTGEIVALASDQTGAAIYSTRDMITTEKQIRDWAAEQAAAYPVIHQQEEMNVRASRPRPIHDQFGFAPPLSELDNHQFTVVSEADLHGLPDMPRESVGRDAGERELLLQGEALLHVDDVAAGRSASVRRPDDAPRQTAVAAAPHRLDASTIDRYLVDRAAAGRPLTDEQGVGLHWIGQHGGGQVVVEGGAGTGKTISIMQGAADLYFGLDYKIYATAQRWVTTLDLAKLKTPDGKHIEGRAAAKWIADYKAGKAKFDDKTVLLVDEAGQMGSREAHALMQIARNTGCRIIWTGDRRQQKSVAAGDPLTVLARELGSHRLEESQRMQATAADVVAFQKNLPAAEAHRQAMALTAEQRAELVQQHGVTVEAAGAVWARKMADDFAYGRAGEALQALRDHEQLVWTDTHVQALDQAVADWADYKAANPDATAVVSAARHSDVQGLNDRMREHLRELGQIGADLATVEAVTPSGDKYTLALAIGDQVRIGANLKELGAYNGMIGIVRKIEAGTRLGHPLLRIDLHTPEGVRSIKIETQRLADDRGRVRLAHGYAGTNVLIQGATETAMFAQISSRDRSNAAYVVGSRARQVTMLYVSREAEDIALKQGLPLAKRPTATFTDQQREDHLARALSRAQVKRSSLDYEAAMPAEPAAEIRAATADLAAVRTQQPDQELEMAERKQQTRTEQDRPRTWEELDAWVQSAYEGVHDETSKAAYEVQREEYWKSIEAEIGPLKQQTMAKPSIRRANRSAAVGEEVTAKPVKGKVAEPPPSRPQAAVAETPAAAMKAFFGRDFSDKLLQHVAAVEVLPTDTVKVKYQDQSETHHHADGTTVHNGRMTEEKAALAAEMIAASGIECVHLTGSMSAKEIMARSCVQRGVDVENAEMQEYVKQVRREMDLQAKTKQEASQESAGRQPTPAQQQNPQASSAALRTLEIGRLARELPRMTDQIARFAAATRLGELTADVDNSRGANALAMANREAAAAAIIADPALQAQAQQAGMLEQVATVHHEILQDAQQHQQQHGAEEELEAEAE